MQLPRQYLHKIKTKHLGYLSAPKLQAHGPNMASMLLENNND